MSKNNIAYFSFFLKAFYLKQKHKCNIYKKDNYVCVIDERLF